jgi:DNA-binding phage protein
MNDAVASYLTNCDREQQERFIQALTGHIRETENVEA